MYVPAHFEETRLEVLRRLVHDHTLGTLVTLGADGLNANPVPFELDPDVAPLGVLRAHVSRDNPAWRELSGPVSPLVVFQGASTYVSPSAYPSKREHGRVVPTYNYLVVHAYGQARSVEDPAWLRAHVGRLSEGFERARPDPWRVDDAPPEFIVSLLRAIGGIEIRVTRLVGKWKASQNRTLADRLGVLEALEGSEEPDAHTIAQAIRERLESRDDE